MVDRSPVARSRLHSITSSARASIKGGSGLDYDGGSAFLAAMAVKYCPAVVFGGRFLRRKIICARRYAREQPTTSERTAAQIGSVRNTAIPKDPAFGQAYHVFWPPSGSPTICLPCLTGWRKRMAKKRSNVWDRIRDAYRLHQAVEALETPIA
jgi:hypothetical protein